MTTYPPDADVVFERVVPGGSSSGDACFRTNDERGSFTVRYDPVSGLSPASWTIDVT